MPCAASYDASTLLTAPRPTWKAPTAQPATGSATAEKRPEARPRKKPCTPPFCAPWMGAATSPTAPVTTPLATDLRPDDVPAMRLRGFRVENISNCTSVSSMCVVNGCKNSAGLIMAVELAFLPRQLPST